MSCKNNSKKEPKSSFDISSISGLLKVILGAFNLPTTPVSALPPVLIMTGAKMRPGLSASKIAARIISRQTDAGKPSGDIFGDGPNVDEAMEVIRVDEIINAILTEAKVDVVIPPGTQISAVGVGNMGAPVVSQGATTGMAVGDGIVR